VRVTTYRLSRVRFALLIALILPLLAGCLGSSSDDGATISWREVPPTPTPELLTGVGGSTGPLPPTTGERNAPGSVAPPMLTAQELVTHQPNEIGFVPILEYHVITTDPTQEAQFVRTVDDMRADLEWLYANNFYVVPLSDVVDNTIAVPAGKHPVALTFDDGTSSHFSYKEDADGEIVLDKQGNPVIDPNCAVGILEAFYAEHPDFGRGGHFAPLIFNAFAYPDTEQDAHFDEKVRWLVDHGYEVGNHTHQHTDLTDISNEEFMMTIAEPQIYMDTLLGDHPGNASDILTLPYGSTPDRDLHPDQRQMMELGFEYEGHSITLRGALLVGSDPAPSPASTDWHKLWIPRIQMFDDSVDLWFGMFERGEVVLYTSDGHPETIAVPNPQHPELEGKLDATVQEAAGRSVILYDPVEGTTLALGARDAVTANVRWREYARR
jgi:hypothetical protein